MDSKDNGTQLVHDLTPFFQVYNDGRVERLELAPSVLASLDPQTGVDSKDIEILPEKEVGARLFKPNMVQCPKNKKLPIVVYYHGGGFVVQSTYSALFHNYLNYFASRARVLIVSVEYRLAPEHPLPACYDDCWDTLNWVVSHADNVSNLPGSSFTPEPWLRDDANFSKIFLAGDSAGANIAHQIALRVGNQGLVNGLIRRVNGVIVSHPFFWGNDRIGDEVAKLKDRTNPDFVDYSSLWKVVCPGTSGLDDPWINPTRDPNLGKLGGKKVLVFVAENDLLRDRGLVYKETLEKSGWSGNVEIVESLGEKHAFHVHNPYCANAVDMMTKVVNFINFLD